MANLLSNVSGLRLDFVRLLGTGAAAPTKEFGPGITVTRTSEGLLKFTWTENPGEFVGIAGYAFGDTTPADVKGHTIARDTYSEATSTADAYIEVAMYDSTFAVDDLEATEYLDICFAFKTSAG